MRWLKHVLTVGLLLAAAAVAVATAFSDHSGEYGEVALPSGGVVHLPKDTVTVYQHDGTAGFGFQVVPVVRWESDSDEVGRRNDRGERRAAQ